MKTDSREASWSWRCDSIPLNDEIRTLWPNNAPVCVLQNTNIAKKLIKKKVIKRHRARCFASKPGKPKTPEQTIRKKLMPVLLYLTFLSKRM